MHTPLSRRSFLRTAPASGALALALGPETLAAEARTAAPPAHSQTKAQFEAAARRLEQLGQEFLGVAPLEGQFLHLLVRLTRARRVLEIGSCFGLGSIWMGLALEAAGGSLLALELLPERAAKARQLLADFGLANRVSVQQGDAHELVKSVEGTFDLALLNADKSGALDYFEKLSARGLAPAATLAITGVVRDPETMKPLLATLQTHPGFDATIVQVIPEDGFLLASRRQP